MRVIALRQSSGVLSNPSSRQVGRRGETESDLIRAGSGTLTVVEDKQWRKSELSDWVSASKESEPAQALLENHLRGFENSWLATTYRESTRIQERLVRNRMAERLTQYRKMLSRNSWNDPAQMLGLRRLQPPLIDSFSVSRTLPKCLHCLRDWCSSSTSVWVHSV